MTRFAFAQGAEHAAVVARAVADDNARAAGLVISVPQEIKGTAMGLHSLMGFGAGLVGPALFGATLDISRYFGYGGWAAAYASIVVWGLMFIFYTQFSLWKNKRVVQ